MIEIMHSKYNNVRKIEKITKIKKKRDREVIIFCYMSCFYLSSPFCFYFSFLNFKRTKTLN